MGICSHEKGLWERLLPEELLCDIEGYNKMLDPESASLNAEQSPAVLNTGYIGRPCLNIPNFYLNYHFALRKI